MQAGIVADPFCQASVRNIDDNSYKQTPVEAHVDAVQALQGVNPQAVLAQAKREAQDALALADAMAAVAQDKAAVAEQARRVAKQAALLNAQAASKAMKALNWVSQIKAAARGRPAAVGPENSLAARIADIEAHEEALRVRSAAVCERELKLRSQEAAMNFREQALRMREADLNMAVQGGSAPIQQGGDSPRESQAADLARRVRQDIGHRQK